MSSYFKAWNTFLSGKDPDSYTPEPPPVVARTDAGKPIAQGLEAGTLTWDVMSLADYINLWSLWNTNKNVSGVFKIPPCLSGSWTSWRSITAYAEEPRGEYRGWVVRSVTMHIVNSP